ncbi:receptor-like protein EIX2 isoform X4 [Cajanus cajan]|uniref:receptor-like protein EIX2 isoform X4 n=1 Tax=Cajanus cajan TaxID=3821 RepID=UPI00098DB2BE|nr:receptor-like protein EIX2 isoform X4 [Cajanus cajan]
MNELVVVMIMSIIRMRLKLKMLMMMVCLVWVEVVVCGDEHEIQCIQREREALLQFKAALFDDYGMLSSWTTPHCCQWKGIRCSNLTRHVLMLDLHGEIHDDEYAYNSYEISRSLNSGSYLSGEIHKSLMELQQLYYFNLTSNSFYNTHIPEFLGSLTNLISLDLSFCGFEGKIPTHFGSLSHLKYLNLAGNFHLEASIIPPQLGNLSQLQHLDLRYNSFEGKIPSQLGNLSKLQYLDLSYNSFEGNIPSQLGNLSNLQELYLGGNIYGGDVALKIYDGGKIPTSMGSLFDLQALLLRNNNLTNEIPFSLRNCTKLVMLDMAKNKLSSRIPAWIGSKLQELQILSLGMNHFYGSLPLEICYLRSIQLLDLSLNNLSGKIPTCIKNFTSMAQNTFSSDYEGHWYFVNTSNIKGNRSYDLNAFLMWKGSEQMFKTTELLLLKSIDLSSNHFSEEIPIEIENLFGLISLNLSRNNLTGKIPSNIGKLSSLEFLDLSRNQFVDSIPQSLTQIDRLAMLDLSHNHLTGEIPTGTQLQSFPASSFEDNLDLCGPPLEKSCIDHGEHVKGPKVEIDENENSLLSHEFYISMTFGFVISFWMVLGSILFKRSWSHAYFKFSHVRR